MEGALQDVAASFSVLEDAFKRSNLPKFEKRAGFINPLGMEDYDWFVHNMLSNAGITVECIGAGVEGRRACQSIRPCRSSTVLTSRRPSSRKTSKASRFATRKTCSACR